MQLTVKKVQRIKNPSYSTTPTVSQQHGIQQIEAIHNIFNNRQNERYVS